MGNESTDLIALIQRLRRAMPRNLEVLKLCAALERLLGRCAELERQLTAANSSVNMGVNKASSVNTKANSRAAYMREYMRRRRAMPADALLTMRAPK
jgi:hypothetical protein